VVFLFIAAQQTLDDCVRFAAKQEALALLSIKNCDYHHNRITQVLSASTLHTARRLAASLA
jgi:hypothetical protein